MARPPHHVRLPTFAPNMAAGGRYPWRDRGSALQQKTRRALSLSPISRRKLRPQKEPQAIYALGVWRAAGVGGWVPPSTASRTASSNAPEPILCAGTPRHVRAFGECGAGPHRLLRLGPTSEPGSPGLILCPAARRLHLSRLHRSVWWPPRRLRARHWPQGRRTHCDRCRAWPCAALQSDRHRPRICRAVARVPLLDTVVINFVAHHRS